MFLSSNAPSASTRKRSRPERSEQPCIPIHVEGPRVNYEKLASERQGEPSAAVRERVSAARLRQSERFHGTRLLTNADMGPAEGRRYCQLDAAGQRLMQAAMRQLHLSARAYHRVLKLARTIADLAGTQDIGPAHLAETIQYRFRSVAYGLLCAIKAV
jgi:magnesium chelatase family protein